MDQPSWTTNTLWEHGDLTTPPRISGYGISQWHPQTYLPSQLPTLGWNRRSSPYMTLTVNPYRNTQADPRLFATPIPGYSYPILIDWGSDYAWRPEEGSQASPTHQTWTPLPRNTSPTGSDSSETTSSTHSNTTIGAGDAPLGTPSIPIETTTTGLSSPSKTEEYSALNEPLPGISDGRISKEDSQPPAEGSENPWVTTSPPSMETGSWVPLSNAEIPSWPGSSATRTESYTHPQRETAFMMPTFTPPKNRDSWRMPFGSSLPERMTGYGTRVWSPNFEEFHYDYPAEFHPSQSPEDIPDFHMFGVDLLSDSPPRNIQ